MKKWILIVIVIGMVGWAIFDYINSERKSAEQMEKTEIAEQADENQDDAQNTDDNAEADKEVIGLEVGNIAPDFQLKTLTGDTVKLSDYRGNRVMVNFWATWCPPCRAEMPDIEKFYQDKDVVVLGVNLTDTESGQGSVEGFVEVFKLTFPVLLDEDLQAADLYRIQPIPTTYMVDSKGIIRYKAYGAMNYDLMVQEFEKME